VLNPVCTRKYTSESDDNRDRPRLGITAPQIRELEGKAAQLRIGSPPFLLSTGQCLGVKPRTALTPTWDESVHPNLDARDRRPPVGHPGIAAQ
jgi:hypothetical protein